MGEQVTESLGGPKCAAATLAAATESALDLADAVHEDISLGREVDLCVGHYG
jgi:hypothetical protein